MTWSAIFVLLITIIIKVVSCDDDEKHCSHIISTWAETSSSTSYDLTQVEINTVVSFKLALHQTACIRINVNNSDGGHNNSSSIILRVNYAHLQHVYPVLAEYDFAVPLIKTTCVCKCTGGPCIPSRLRRRLLTYNCGPQPSDMCVTTRHINPQQSECSLCCKVHLRPVPGSESRAYYVAQSNFMANLDFTVFDAQNELEIERHSLNSSLERHQTLEIFRDKNESPSRVLITAARPHRLLTNAHHWIWTLKNETEFRYGVPVNGLYETNMEKLGWFKQNHYGEWLVFLFCL